MVDTQSQPNTGTSSSATTPSTTTPRVTNPSPAPGPSAANLHKKWRRGCTPANWPGKDIAEFTKWKIEKYRAAMRTGPALSEAFADDFQEFTKEAFSQCGT